MGIFITIEGIDGSGKTTVAGIAEKILKDSGIGVMRIKEPTETPLGMFIRAEVLGRPFNEEAPSGFLKNADPKTFALASIFLFSADRAVHIDSILSMLNSVDVLICDRFMDSTYAYQAAGADGVGQDLAIGEFILNMSSFILKRKGLAIDRTYLIDVEPETAIGRSGKRDEKKDGFDSLSVDFFRSVRKNYADLAAMYPDRIVTIDGMASAEASADIIVSDIKAIINNKKSRNK